MIKKQIGIIVLLVALIFSGMAYLSIEQSKNKQLKKDVVLHEVITDIELGDGKLAINDDGTVDMINKNKEVIKTGSLPLYSRDNKEIILTDCFSYFVPANGNTFDRYKVESLTSVYFDESIYKVCFEKNTSKVSYYDGFLYDGNNLFIALEDGELVYNDNTIEFGKFSYIIVEPNYYVQYFNTKTNECVYDTCEGTVNALFKYYSVNLTLDTYKSGNRESYMIANYENLTNVFKGGE